MHCYHELKLFLWKIPSILQNLPTGGPLVGECGVYHSVPQYLVHSYARTMQMGTFADSSQC